MNLGITVSDYVYVTVYAYPLSLVMRCSGCDQWLVGNCVQVAFLLSDVVSVGASFCARVTMYGCLWWCIRVCVYARSWCASFLLVPCKHVSAWGGLGCARQGGARYAQLCWWVQWGQLRWSHRGGSKAAQQQEGEKAQALLPNCPEFNSQIFPWSEQATYTLSLSIHICKMGIIVSMAHGGFTDEGQR